MKPTTTAANAPLATGTFVSGRLTLPQSLQRLVEDDRIVVSGSALATGWRSYLVAESKLSALIRRGARAMWKGKEIAERDADAAMIWTLLEAGMALQVTVKEHRIKYPRELIKGVAPSQIWFLPFRDYAVVTTNANDMEGYVRSRQTSGKRRCSYSK